MEKGFLIYIVCGLIGYFIGNFSSAIVFSKIVAHEDVRCKGSGNAGAANMLRNYGFSMGILTFLTDVAKGAIACIVGRLIGGSMGMYIAAVCVLLGHNWPALLKFKGGKGVSTSIGVMAIVNWQVTIIIFVIAVSLIFITGYISVASIAGFTMAPIVMTFMYFGNWSLVITVYIISAIVITSHMGNIKRLIKGEESKASFKKPKDAQN